MKSLLSSRRILPVAGLAAALALALSGCVTNRPLGAAAPSPGPSASGAAPSGPSAGAVSAPSAAPAVRPAAAAATPPGRAAPVPAPTPASTVTSSPAPAPATPAAKPGAFQGPVLRYADLLKIYVDAKGHEPTVRTKLVGRRIQLKLKATGPQSLVVDPKDEIFFGCVERAPGFKGGPLTAQIVGYEESPSGHGPIVRLDRCR